MLQSLWFGEHGIIKPLVIVIVGVFFIEKDARDVALRTHRFIEEPAVNIELRYHNLTRFQVQCSMPTFRGFLPHHQDR